MPGDPGATVVTNARAYYHYTRGCGCNGHPAFPTPSMGEGFKHNSGASRRGKAEAYLMLAVLMKFIRVIPGCANLAQARNPYSLQGL